MRSATGKFWSIVAHGTEPGRPAAILRAWPLWERTARRLCSTMPIPGTRYGVLDLEATTYDDRAVVLNDGVVIEPGTPVIELHCNNLTILNLARRKASLLTAVRDDLRCLAKWIAESDPATTVKAVYGVTVLGRVSMRLGFTVRSRAPTIRQRMETFFLVGLLLLYNAEGLGRLGKGLRGNYRAEQVWMSRGELLRHYLAKPALPRATVPDGGPNRDWAAQAGLHSRSNRDDGYRSVR